MPFSYTSIPNRPSIDVAAKEHHEVVVEAGRALSSGATQSGLFIHQGTLVRVDGTFRHPLTVSDLLPHLSLAARFEKNGKNVKPDRDVAQAILNDPPSGIPEIAYIAHGPVLSRAGRLVLKRGYNKAAKVFLLGTSIPPPPRAPRAADVRAAMNTLLDLIQDFPFADEASRAATIALLITLITRPHIDGPVPLFVVSAPSPGTGKTLLILALSAVFSARSPHITALPSRSEEEVRRKLLSTLTRTEYLVLFDNVTGRLDSDALAAVLTSRTFSDRIIGSSADRTVVNDTVLAVTGNNLSPSEDIARRSVVIRLESRSANPAAPRHFKHSDLLAWIAKNRPPLQAAAVTLVQAWFARGSPPGPTRLASFERFSEVVGGILQVAGMPNFLSGPPMVDPENETLCSLVAAWAEKFGQRRITSNDFCGLCKDLETWPLALVGRRMDSPGALVQATGNYLRTHKDRIVAGYRITQVRDAKTKINNYQLIPIDGGDRRGGAGTPPRDLLEEVVIGMEVGVGESPKSPPAPANNGEVAP